MAKMVWRVHHRRISEDYLEEVNHYTDHGQAVRDAMKRQDFGTIERVMHIGPMRQTPDWGMEPSIGLHEAAERLSGGSEIEEDRLIDEFCEKLAESGPVRVVINGRAYRIW